MNRPRDLRIDDRSNAIQYNAQGVFRVTAKFGNVLLACNESLPVVGSFSHQSWPIYA